MFFCTKYLSASSLDSWIDSVLDISCPHWRAQLVVWFAEAYAVFSGETAVIADLPDESPIDWAWSHLLNGNYSGEYGNNSKVPFLSEETRCKKFEIIAGRLRVVDLDAWLQSIQQFDHVAQAIEGAVELFRERYH